LPFHDSFCQLIRIDIFAFHAQRPCSCRLIFRYRRQRFSSSFSFADVTAVFLLPPLFFFRSIPRNDIRPDIFFRFVHCRADFLHAFAFLCPPFFITARFSFDFCRHSAAEQQRRGIFRFRRWMLPRAEFASASFLLFTDIFRHQFSMSFSIFGCHGRPLIPFRPLLFFRYFPSPALTVEYEAAEVFTFFRSFIELHSGEDVISLVSPAALSSFQYCSIHYLFSSLLHAELSHSLLH